MNSSPRFNGRIATGLWILLIAVLAATTFLEKYSGSEAAHRFVYGAWWFAGLWALLAICSLLEMFRKKQHRNPPVLVLHLSFIVILAGALCTSVWGERGHILLPKEGVGRAEGIVLPFTLSLDTFYVQPYAGTDTPSDYVSEFTVHDPAAGGVRHGRVSMNHIFSYRNYRFYQASFSPDQTSSVLSINRDPVGIALTYTGYALFVLAGLCWLLRSIPLSRRLKKGAAAALFLLAVSTGAQAEERFSPEQPLHNEVTINKAQAEKFGKLWMLYEGRITSVSVFAHDFTVKLLGKDHFSYMNAEQFLAGMLFFPERWKYIGLFKVKDPALQKLLKSEGVPASIRDFFGLNKRYLLANRPRSKESDQLNDKMQLINLLHSGTLLKLFPLPQDGSLRWHTPVEEVFPRERGGDSAYIRTILSDYRATLHSQNEAKADSILESILAFQQSRAAGFLPSETHKRIEIFYTNHNIVPMLFKVNLTAGVLWLLLLFLLKPGRVYNLCQSLFFVQLLHSFFFLTASIALRTWIGGRLPFASGAEVMLLLAWTAMLLTWIFRRKTALLLPFGLLISGCALLVAHLGMNTPKITPLMPVLSSPLLSLHVSVIMIAYVLLAFTALNGGIALVFHLLRRDPEVLENMRRNSLLCLRPALFFLGTGIFIGAVWANISWGAYWSWDPKEVWALITFLTYALALHKKELPPVAFHLFVLAAFATVLITYFGVNYFFGGLHGYR